MHMHIRLRAKRRHRLIRLSALVVIDSEQHGLFGNLVVAAWASRQGI